jgi:hypothetical protein
MFELQESTVERVRERLGPRDFEWVTIGHDSLAELTLLSSARVRVDPVRYTVMTLSLASNEVTPPASTESE